MSIVNIVLFIWWLLSNAWIQYIEIDFLNMIANKNGYRHYVLWIIINEILVILNICFQFSGLFMVHILLLFVFAVFVLKIRWQSAIAPTIIILTLYTFVEGYSAICMYWVSISIASVVQGTIIQLLISFILDIFFWIMLRLIMKKYFFAMQQSVSSYLYVLLLPCGFIVFIARSGLKLDSHALEKYLSVFGVSASFATLVIMSAAVVIFIIMIKSFNIIACLTEEKTGLAILKAQLDGQKIYIEEAKKRNTEYSRFQHDIDNHLIVLNGLIYNKEYSKAEEYLGQLHIQCESLFIPITTGNSVLDILLKEKLSYAVREGIEVSCNVKIPENFTFDDMDLCIIFANILDNAIHACMNSSCEKSEISIYTKVRAHFLIIEAFNTMNVVQPVKEGIGLTNIKNTAKKYLGTVEILAHNGRFRITVLLCSP